MFFDYTRRRNLLVDIPAATPKVERKEKQKSPQEKKQSLKQSDKMVLDSLELISGKRSIFSDIPVDPSAEIAVEIGKGRNPKRKPVSLYDQLVPKE